MVKIIPRIRPAVYAEPCLRGKPGERPDAGKKTADDEFERRSGERQLLQELSRYYRLEQGKRTWARPSLMWNGKHECHRSTYQ